MVRSRSRSREHRRDRRDRSRSREDRERRRRERDREPREGRDRDRIERDREERYGRRRSRSRDRDGRRKDRVLSRDRRERKDKDGTGPPGPKRNAVPDYLMEKKPLTEADFAGKDDEEIEMMKMMGFGGFESTKGRKVPGNDVSGVHVIQKRKYRQYMNRKGGFNRPLDFVV
ncbi:U4/U6.U5 small nuclear ribonucleoprotein 27 kDa protein-like [Varroa jacobsoni]|uniref:U4/U6.U5 small nuclear ribonucleoprotein 27 kDa protein n=1 Tax=Varroa destructor TaxID=109461 RepID=A0A7M7JWA8_VARDE|nr:U4/U6.U5 small nuclear ribonucleoprotein 27 kDa protein-like [Varroa destructor]XP_022696293.1 U4/U6.U5 small nuclear ribonucleoprotein 27 kDa protein-like [Varroa jacobsoni]